MAGKIFRVSCETYDRAWYVRTKSANNAVLLVRVMTEERGWHLDFPEEERSWEVKEMFAKEDEIWESRDL